ncbi:hypothetical protein B0I35DRAFT_439183 [Stachybotrys elegans]|uniref:Uncharacterized protein n=1 Tax=Stachybotrys elegans TaxID=80388 RepID=A0A8K0SN93_9HYPO|nr:hypothetical protein B0I35DRAFT_439183 [Stachybotrys elegans]
MRSRSYLISHSQSAARITKAVAAMHVLSCFASCGWHPSLSTSSCCFSCHAFLDRFSVGWAECMSCFAVMRCGNGERPAKDEVLCVGGRRRTDAPRESKVCCFFLITVTRSKMVWLVVCPIRIICSKCLPMTLQVAGGVENETC